MNNTFKALTSIALLASTAQLVHAHAGFKDQITEGSVKTWNAVNIGHGCASNTATDDAATGKDVIAISVLFPNSTLIGDAIYRASKGNVAVSGEETVITNLADHIVGSSVTKGLKADLNVITAGGTMFANTIPIFDAVNGADAGHGVAPTMRGWQGWQGKPNAGGSAILESRDTGINTVGLSPFGINAFQFKPESCAKTLRIRVAVANWCMNGAGNNKNPDRVDLWFGRTTTKFNELLLMPSKAADNVIFWSTLTVNRDLALNPLPGTKGFNPLKITTNGGVIDRTVAWEVSPAKAAVPATSTVAEVPAVPAVKSNKVSCTDDYDTVYIEPTNADIDKFLPISAAKYPKGTSGVLYWPTTK
ncbi:MAG: hypothetical protein RL236_1043 [Pseudomonadota bacterium]|jgi:hypothetical protein